MEVTKNRIDAVSTGTGFLRSVARVVMKGLAPAVMALGLLSMGSGAMASTVLSPTNEDANFLFIPTALASGFELHLLDDAATIGSSPSLKVALTNNLAGMVTFGGPGYVATSGSNFLNLTGSFNFILALFDTTGSGTWYADTGAADIGGGTMQVSFLVGGSPYAVDVAAVPLPAAAWLFGSARPGGDIKA